MNAPVLKPTCCGRVWNTFNSHACGKTAKFERDGKWYCGIHDPVAKAEKNAKKQAEWTAKWEARDASQAAAKAKQAELERRAACYDKLLEALLLLDPTGQFTDWEDDKGREIGAQLKAAVYKAVGATA